MAVGGQVMKAWHTLAHDGRLWVAVCVTKCGAILVLATDGTSIATIDSPHLVNAADLSVGPDRSIVVAD